MTDKTYKRIQDCEGIIYKLCSNYSSYYNIEDLYQAGCIGVIKASKKYNNNQSVKFSTYAYKFILGEIIDYIRKDRSIIISDEAYSIYKKYSKIKKMLSSKYEKEVSFNEVCSYMNIDEQYMLAIIEGVSFSKDIEGNGVYIPSIDNRDNIDNEILIKNELDSLNDKDKSLIDYRYYMGYTQSETAKLMGTSQVSISRNEKMILQRIKNNLAS